MGWRCGLGLRRQSSLDDDAMQAVYVDQGE
jgi:hypothetical protein